MFPLEEANTVQVVMELVALFSIWVRMVLLPIFTLVADSVQVTHFTCYNI